jgi:hypothetical protein
MFSYSENRNTVGAVPGFLNNLLGNTEGFGRNYYMCHIPKSVTQEYGALSPSLFNGELILLYFYLVPVKECEYLICLYRYL